MHVLLTKIDAYNLASISLSKEEGGRTFAGGHVQHRGLGVESKQRSEFCREFQASGMKAVSQQVLRRLAAVGDAATLLNLARGVQCLLSPFAEVVSMEVNGVRPLAEKSNSTAFT